MEKREDNGMQGHGRTVGEKGRGHQVEQHPGRCCSPLSPKPTPESTAKLPPAFPWEEKQALLLQGGDFR